MENNNNKKFIILDNLSTFKDKVLEFIENKIVQSDYEEGDSTKPSYIKNRTHYLDKTLLYQFSYGNQPTMDLSIGSTYLFKVYTSEGVGEFTLLLTQSGNVSVDIYNSSQQLVSTKNVQYYYSSGHISLYGLQYQTLEIYSVTAKALDSIYLPKSVLDLMGTGLKTGTGQYSVIKESSSAAGDYANALGFYCQASGTKSNAEGYSTMATGEGSHSEGYGAKASGTYSHAEGNYCTAEGSSSHAEGNYCTAEGSSSHAEGSGTVAKNWGEHAEGTFNVSNKTTGNDALCTIHSVGIGDSINKKNAHEIMKNGDMYVYGLGGYNGKNISEAQTLQEVISGLNTGDTDAGISDNAELNSWIAEIYMPNINSSQIENVKVVKLDSHFTNYYQVFLVQFCDQDSEELFRWEAIETYKGEAIDRRVFVSNNGESEFNKYIALNKIIDISKSGSFEHTFEVSRINIQTEPGYCPIIDNYIQHQNVIYLSSGDQVPIDEDMIYQLPGLVGATNLSESTNSYGYNRRTIENVINGAVKNVSILISDDSSHYDLFPVVASFGGNRDQYSISFVGNFGYAEVDFDILAVFEQNGFQMGVIYTYDRTLRNRMQAYSGIKEFDGSKSYAVNDIVTEDGKLYICTVAHTGGWNADHFSETTFAELWKNNKTSFYEAGSGNNSVVKSGSECHAIGNYSHAEGLGVVAEGPNTFSCGAYNLSSPKNIFEVGIGISNTIAGRKNAFAVGQEGDIRVTPRYSPGNEGNLTLTSLPPILELSTSAGMSRTITLPSLSTIPDGTICHIRHSGGGGGQANITIQGSVDDKIALNRGSGGVVASCVLTQGSELGIYRPTSDGLASPPSWGVFHINNVN